MLCPYHNQIQKIASRWHAKGAVSDGFFLWWGFPLKVQLVRNGSSKDSDMKICCLLKGIRLLLQHQ